MGLASVNFGLMFVVNLSLGGLSSSQTVIFHSGFAARKEIFHEFFNEKFAVSRLLRVRRRIFLKFVQNFFGLLNAMKN